MNNLNWFEQIFIDVQTWKFKNFVGPAVEWWVCLELWDKRSLNHKLKTLK
jgi:hypothetical protein